MAFIVTDFNEYKSYGNCLNERFIFHLAILKGVARMGKYFLRHWRQNSRDGHEPRTRSAPTEVKSFVLYGIIP